MPCRKEQKAQDIFRALYIIRKPVRGRIRKRSRRRLLPRQGKAMNNVRHDIFRAIHEGKWLKIEYKNREGQITRYWIGIRDLDPLKGTLKVDGLHLGRYTVEAYDFIY